MSSVSLGYWHSAAVTTNGDLYCWGRNYDGQIGDGTTTNRYTPVKVLENVSSVSLGEYHSAAVTTNGDLYCWGGNYDGQIGDGTNTNRNTPVKVLENVSSVSLGYGHSAAVTADGDLYCWGNNYHGQIGDGTTTDRYTPVKIMDNIATGSKTPSSNHNGLTNINSSSITIKATDYSSFEGLDGAKTEIEGIGEAVTDNNGVAQIANSLTDSSAMRRISITKEGYRDYILYTTIVSPKLVNLFATNQFSAALKKKTADDNTKPYVSTVVYYQNEIAKSCAGQRFVSSDTVTFRVCGVWNDKEPGNYCMYQVGGRSYTSKDGIFNLNIGDSFAGTGKIYVKLMAKDGTESEAEKVYITVPEGRSPSLDEGISILNQSSESGWQTDVPFLNNDKLSFDLGKIKTTIKRDGSKIRIMLGREGSKDIFSDAEWEEWKKFCKSQPMDLSCSQWKNVIQSDNLNTSWTANAKIKATGYGWLENDMSEDTTAPLTGGIQIAIDMSTAFKQQYVVGVVPVYLEESLGVNSKFDGSITYDTTEEKFGGSTAFKVTPSLSVGGGVGVLYVATVGAEGSASMPMVIDFPKGLTQTDLEGSLSIKASVLGFDYKKEMAKATYPLYRADETATVNSTGAGDAISDTIAFYDMNSYSLPDTSAVETKWHGSGQSVPSTGVSQTRENLTETLLQTGTSELTEPILVQEGATTLAVFLTEDTTRNAIHRTKLVYTIYDKTSRTWSNPKAVSEDGTGDFYPYITSVNGKIAVSWLNYADSVTDSSSMKEALQTSSLCYAVWDESTNRFSDAFGIVSSSSDFSYNSAKVCLDTNDNVTAVGLKNSNADIFGVTGENILFMRGTYNTANIDREFSLTQGIPVSYDATVWNNMVTAAVCLDTDRNLTTLEDREIYLLSSDGNITRLTGNDTYDSAPQYAKYQGENALFWYTDSGYHVLKASGEESRLLEEERAQISENYTVINGENRETALVWSGIDENQIYQLTACIYDTVSGKWSHQVMVSDSDENIFRPSGYFNADGNMEFLYRKGKTTEAGSLYALQVTQAPDLQLVNAYIEDGTEVPGQKTTVFVGVKNLGTKPITQYSISVDGQITDETTNILPGETALLEADYTVPDTVVNGEILIQATVEEDCDTSNNTFQLTTGYSDVSITATEDEWENGKIVHVAVGNSEAVSTNASLEIHKNSIDGELVSSMELGTLKQGDVVSVDFIYPKEADEYVVGANALYYVVTSSAVEKYDSNNYDYSVFSEKEMKAPEEVPSEPAPSTIAVTGVTLNKSTLTLDRGTTVTLTAAVAPTNATDKTVLWDTSDSSIATVDAHGIVKALKKGTALITATAGGKTATCVVTVAVPSTKVKLNTKTVYMVKGKSLKVKATMTPSDTTDTLAVSNTKNTVATASLKKNIITIKAKKAGKTIITVKTTSGKYYKCTVNVVSKGKKSTKIKLNKKNLSIQKGASYDLVPTLTKKTSTDTIKWSSSNKKVATVDAYGTVTGKKGGIVTITAKSSSGKKATCKVTVKSPATKVTFAKKTIRLKVGGTATLKAKLTPSDSTDTLKWKSSNKKVVTAAKTGKLKGIKKGVATITVTTTSGKKATCKVTVK